MLRCLDRLPGMTSLHLPYYSSGESAHLNAPSSTTSPIDIYIDIYCFSIPLPHVHDTHLYVEINLFSSIFEIIFTLTRKCFIVNLQSYPIELRAVFDMFVKCVDFDSTMMVCCRGV